MSCGNIFLQDPNSNFWVLFAGDNGQLVTSRTTPVQFYVPPVLNSPSFTWQLSATTNGIITASVVSPQAAPTSIVLSSLHQMGFGLSIADSGLMMTTGQGALTPFVVPYPSDVSMSAFPPTGIISSVAGATPLTVSADYSIWSCTLNRFINEDTTNIIVVLDE